MTDSVETVPAIAITHDVKVGNRSLVLQTYVSRDAPLPEIHRVCDILASALDRQQAKYELEDLRANLEVHETTLANLEADYLRIGEGTAKNWAKQGKKGDPQATASEQAQKVNVEQNIKRYRQEITKLQAKIAQHVAVLKG